MYDCNITCVYFSCCKPALCTWLEETLPGPLLLLKSILVLFLHQPGKFGLNSKPIFYTNNLQTAKPPVQGGCLLPPLFQSTRIFPFVPHFFCSPKIGAFDDLSETSQPPKVFHEQYTIIYGQASSISQLFTFEL